MKGSARKWSKQSQNHPRFKAEEQTSPVQERTERSHRRRAVGWETWPLPSVEKTAYRSRRQGEPLSLSSLWDGGQIALAVLVSVFQQYEKEN